MDGALTIIDGEPGRGKTLAAIRLMVQSAKRGRNIITNVALKPEFIRRIRNNNYNIQIIQPTAEEMDHFWQYTPENCDVYIDEAHLIWDSDAWKTNRVAGFKSYISQFRKDGDSVWLLAQSYENLDKFIRQRSTRIISCRRFSWPGFLPGIGSKPIVFIVTHWSTREGERDKRSRLPEIYTPAMCADTYTLYDTRGKVDTTRNTHTRKQWGDIMPTVLTAQPPPGQQPVININQNPQKKRHPILMTIAIVAAASIGYATLKNKQSTGLKRQIAVRITRAAKNPNKINYYGVINEHVVLSQHGTAGNWPVKVKVAKWEITGYNSDGIMLHGPNGLHNQPWWRPTVKPKTSRRPTQKKTGLANLGL